MRQPLFISLLSLALCAHAGSLQALNLSAIRSAREAASAQPATDKAQPPIDKAQPGNTRFVQLAMLGNRAEVELAKAALQRSKDPQLQDFARRTIIDNSAAADELEQLAATSAVDIPYRLDDAHLQTLDQLNSLFGSDFDSAFSACMYQTQSQTLSLFSAAVHDARLRSPFRLFAMKMLSIAQMHQLDAKNLTKKYVVAQQAAIDL